MKVWVIGRGYPTKRNQMAGSFELEQAKVLARRGMEVTYLAVDVRAIRNLIGYVSRQEDGVTISVLNLPFGRLLKRSLRDRLLIKAMLFLEKRLIKRNGLPDVVHVHYPSYFPYGMVKQL